MLEKHEYILELHAQQLLSVRLQKHCTHVDVEVFEPSNLFCKVCIPQSHYRLERQFSQQSAVHPAKAELHVLHALRHEVIMKIMVQAMNQVLEAQYHPLQAWLRKCVVVLNIIQKLAHTPVSIRFHGGLAKEMSLWNNSYNGLLANMSVSSEATSHRRGSGATGYMDTKKRGVRRSFMPCT